MDSFYAMWDDIFMPHIACWSFYSLGWFSTNANWIFPCVIANVSFLMVILMCIKCTLYHCLFDMVIQCITEYFYLCRMKFVPMYGVLIGLQEVFFSLLVNIVYINNGKYIVVLYTCGRNLRWLGALSYLWYFLSSKVFRVFLMLQLYGGPEMLWTWSIVLSMEFSCLKSSNDRLMFQMYGRPLRFPRLGALSFI